MIAHIRGAIPVCLLVVGVFLLVGALMNFDTPRIGNSYYYRPDARLQGSVGAALMMAGWLIRR
ncbi:MAG: hypothetical protein ABFD89_15470 [Bryobacteraceae bacterium]